MPDVPTRVLIAFDKFKDSLTAERACEVAAQALAGRHPDWQVDQCPFTDGGDGFERLLTAAARGNLVAHTVQGPLLVPTNATIGYVRAGDVPPEARQLLGWESFPAEARIAVIGMASASGLADLSPAQRDPWKTTSVGTGQLIAAATAAGAHGIVLGLGGSATHDLALGALGALGFRFQSGDGATIEPPVPGTWPTLEKICRGPLVLPPIRIACDVDNPLLGVRGAAAVFGPQKGLRPEDLPRLEAESARLSELLCLACGEPLSRREAPGSGAAGGAGFGLTVGAGARIVPGSELVAAWVDLPSRMATADLIITGEGRFDESSLGGKGPAVLARQAHTLGKRVEIFAGSATAAAPAPGIGLHGITPAGQPLAEALAAAAANLARAVAAVF